MKDRSRPRLIVVMGLGFAVLLAIGVIAQAATQTLFARELTPLFGDAQDGTAIGNVTPGTPVQSAETSSGRTSITMDGWAQQGGDTVIYTAVGQRIVLATLTQAGLAHRQILDTARDAYGNTWNHVQVTGFADSGEFVPDVNVVWTAAHQLYSTRCSACHALHATTDFTANQWPGILQTMEKNAALDPQQSALITQYLQTHARAP